MTPGEERGFGSVLSGFNGQLRCNSQTSDKGYVDNRKKNKMAPDMIYKARITKNTDIERRRISENYKIAKQPC